MSAEGSGIESAALPDGDSGGADDSDAVRRGLVQIDGAGLFIF